MKNSRIYPLAICILLVVLLVSGCAAPKTTPDPTSVPLFCPTTAPLSCPTTAPLSCPTTAAVSSPTIAAQVMPEKNGWRQLISSYANVVITFDKGDKCSMEVISPLTDSNIDYEIVVNDSAYQNYMLVGLILDPGRTLEDLESWYSSAEGPPPWSQGAGIDIVSSMSRTALGHNVPITGQLYYTCFVQGPDALKIIGSVGPIEVPAK